MGGATVFTFFVDFSPIHHSRAHFNIFSFNALYWIKQSFFTQVKNTISVTRRETIAIISRGSWNWIRQSAVDAWIEWWRTRLRNSKKWARFWRSLPPRWPRPRPRKDAKSFPSWSNAFWIMVSEWKYGLLVLKLMIWLTMCRNKTIKKWDETWF